jgi:triphosphoribosyl-dephospho-CoA synthase
LGLLVNKDQNLWRRVIEPLHGRADFIRTACVLEATAPKVGNVHPNASFKDLTYDHFVTAAECTSDALADLDDLEKLGPAILHAVENSRQATQTNANLGIVLLLGPLLASEPIREGDQHADRDEWRERIEKLLERLSPQHGGFIAAAIAVAGPGGMDTDTVDEANPLNIHHIQIRDRHIEPYDLMHAMRLSAGRDRIALQYAAGFADLFEKVVPTIHRSISQTGDLLSGIVLAHVRLIADSGDSLIARKGGLEASDQAKRWAKICLESYDAESLNQLDNALRGDDNRRNPGTTADLIAAGLYVYLRSIP